MKLRNLISVEETCQNLFVAIIIFVDVDVRWNDSFRNQDYKLVERPLNF